MSAAKEERCTKCGRLVGLSCVYVDGAVYHPTCRFDPEIARLQEQVETLTRSRDGYAKDSAARAIESDRWKLEAHTQMKRSEAAEAERDRLREENERLRKACKLARLHAPIIRLAPERRHTIAVLDAALQKEPQP